MSQAARKITVEVPAELLAKAQTASGVGITQTIRAGLELVAAGKAYERLLQLKEQSPVLANVERIESRSMIAAGIPTRLPPFTSPIPWRIVRFRVGRHFSF